MKKYVVDTSVAVKWFSKENDSEGADKLLKALEEKKIEIYLPELVKYELANALLKGKKLNFAQAQATLKTFYMLPLILVAENFELAKTSYFLAEKLNITYYDACFFGFGKNSQNSSYYR